MKAITNIDDIQLFITVAAFGSFSAAARRVGCTASSVARRIDSLEARLTARLFNRTTRVLNLTDAGEIYLDYAKTISAQLSEAESAVSQATTTPKGRLRITSPRVLGRLYIAPVIN